MPKTKKQDVPKEVNAFKFEKQPSSGEKANLCCWYALHHYSDGSWGDIKKFKQKAAEYYMKNLSMTAEDALALALDGNDPAVAKALASKKKGKAHIMNLKNVHFYTVREITVGGEKQWWSFDSYNFDCPQRLESLAKAPGSKIL